LLLRREGRTMRQRRLLVEFERQVLEHQAHLARIFREQLRHVIAIL
jgi:hypothetical protein